MAVRCEEVVLSGGMVRQKAKYERFLNKRNVSNPRRGAVKFRCVRWQHFGLALALCGGCSERGWMPAA